MSLLGQEGYAERLRGGVLNPLERLLASALHGLRSGPVRVANDSWGTQEWVVKVVGGDARKSD